MNMFVSLTHLRVGVELEEPREDVDDDEGEDGHDEHPRLQVVPRAHERVTHCGGSSETCRISRNLASGERLSEMCIGIA